MKAIAKREDIFVTTKMWTSDYDDGERAIEASLQRLGLDYIDLMILHHSQPSNDAQAYQAMEKAVEEGKLRSIGLSNYYEPADFDRLVSATTVKPALLQNETHPYHQSKAMKEHIAQYGTVMESWFPLGGRGNTQTLFNDETISGIAAAHGKTSAQVIPRWHLQADIGAYVSDKTAAAGWGKSVASDFSAFLRSRCPTAKGFFAQNIWRMKQFYETYRDKKLSPLVREISWTNNLLSLSS